MVMAIDENTVTFSKSESRITWILLVMWVFYVGLLISFIPPYWAQMDDPTFINMKPVFTELGLGGWIKHFVKQDFTWGMFRPVFAIFIYAFYGFFGHSNRLAYIAVYLMNLAIFCIWARAFVRCLISSSAKVNLQNRLTWFSLFVILCFHFLRNYHLFYFSILQERLVLLFIGLAIHCLLNMEESWPNSVLRWPFLLGSIGCVALAFLSKAPAVSFCLLFSFWLASSGMANPKMRKLCWLGAIVFLIVFIFATVYFSSIRQGYTAAFQKEWVTEHLLDPQSKFYKVSALSMSAICFVLIDFSLTRERDWCLLVRKLIWPLGMIVYMTIMLPWKNFLDSHLIIPVGIFGVGTKLIILRYSVPLLNRWKTLPYAMIFILVTGITSFTPMRKFYQMAIHHHGTQKVLTYLENRIAESTDRLVVRMPDNCSEASWALSTFLHKPGFIQQAGDGDPFYISASNNVGETRLLVCNRECKKFPESFAPYREVLCFGEWRVLEMVKVLS